MASEFTKDSSVTMDPNQLASQIKEATGLEVQIGIDQEKVFMVVLGEVPANQKQTVQKLVDDYEYDADWDKPELKRLKELRDKASLSQDEAAEAVHLFLKETVTD